MPKRKPNTIVVRGNQRLLLVDSEVFTSVLTKAIKHEKDQKNGAPEPYQVMLLDVLEDLDAIHITQTINHDHKHG